VFGFLETIVEYYTGRDASHLTDEALAIKLAHISKIRRIEAEESNGKVINRLFK
jgi:hypothetical protein